MTEVKLPLSKCIFLVSMILIYILFGIAAKILLVSGIINPLISIEEENPNWESNIIEAPYRAEIAKSFVAEVMTRRNGHVNLIYPTELRNGSTDTNSEAVSYYLLWNAMARNKQSFDHEIKYVENSIINPQKYYMMWRLNYNDTPVGDGSNIATDADLRAIKALYIADSQWKDAKYKEMIDKLSSSLEEIAITKDGLFAPYGGVSDGQVWKTEEVWLSYADFEAFGRLAKDKGKKWESVYNNMKKVYLDAQLGNGLYMVQLDENRDYNNKLDSGGHSINNLWMMVRSAESNDPELMASSRKALDFYENKFNDERILYTSYDSNGNALTQSDSPWVYALVGRAASELGEKEFAEIMISKMLEFQVTDEESVYFGAIIEGSKDDPFVSQFTMQESILTLEEYNKKTRLSN